MNVSAEGGDVSRSAGKKIAMNAEEVVVVDGADTRERVEFVEPLRRNATVSC